MSKRSKLDYAFSALGLMNKSHECMTLQESKVDISVELIRGKWYWVFWEKASVEAHGIAYCPYCGEKLEKEEDHESKDN
ncbi:MAG: hypothetical protein IKW37_01365 [Bacteroidaceae bacterium]|nr:hypothetical protein [Bacteroidaceae bacterium]